MQGKIIKGIAGFYYVQTEDKLYECKAKGIFRNKKMKPLVGDNVEIDILDEEDQEGNITKIYERSNELIRPAVANVNQALIIFAAKNPKPNYNLLDRFLMMMENQETDPRKDDSACRTIRSRKIIFDESAPARSTDGNRRSQ